MAKSYRLLELLEKTNYEYHIPNYQFCGPNTKLHESLRKGQTGINPLDAACKEHDIVYSLSGDNSTRSAVDKILENQAFQRFKASDSSMKEKIAALGVAEAM